MGTEQQKSLAADVLGMTGRYDREVAIAQAMATLGYAMQSPIYEEEPARIPEAQEAFEEISRDFKIVGEIIDGDVVHPNTLTDWFMYSAMTETLGRKLEGGGKALMIGSLTAMASRSFVRLAEQEYGADESYIIDLYASTTKAQHSDFFLRASGLNLPFASGSMDVVHTNRLLHMLGNPSSDSDTLDTTIPRLLQEITRVLAPGGQLFMYELTPGAAALESYEDVERLTISLVDFITDRLEKSEYDSVSGLFGMAPSNTDLLFDASRAFPYDAKPNSATFAIYASRDSL